MARYSVFSTTGYGIPTGRDRSLGRRRLHIKNRHEPITTWYVVDLDNCAEVVFQSDDEHEARSFQFYSNADERTWEKEREYEALALGNGRG
jgi:hypothetical protein